MFKRTIKSYVKRERRMTPSQQLALQQHWAEYGIEVDKDQIIDFNKIFNRVAPIAMDIGFGMGDSLIHFATQYVNYNWLGVEVHKPGISAALARAAALDLQNLRVCSMDVKTLFKHHMPKASLQRVFILFPDPWPKRKHHTRRLLQLDFLTTVFQALSDRGILHITTDWPDYAQQVQQLMLQLPSFISCDSDIKRIATKYEQRALRLANPITDLVYTQAG